MSHLAITQIENNETITTGLRLEKTATIRAIRLGLFKYDTPDGILTITLKDGATIIGSSSVTMASLIAAEPATYFHGWVRFDTPDSGWRVNIPKSEAYLELTLEISLTSHTNDNTNYIALVNQPAQHAFVDPFGTITNSDGMSSGQLEYFQPYKVELYAIN